MWRFIRNILLTAISCCFTKLQIEAFSMKFEAFDATEPILRLQQPFANSSAWSRGSRAPDGQPGDVPETLADVLLMPLLPVNDIPSENLSKICHAFVHDMAVEGGNLTHCMIHNARPFLMCEKCVTSHTRFTQLFKDLTKHDRCYTALLMADRMHLMDTINHMFTATWTDAYCDSCFDSVEENTTTREVTFNYTADTLLFQQMQANVSLCFQNYSHTIDTHNKSEVCHACKIIYEDMNNNYKRMEESNGNLCMDLMDMMNYTRLRWSTHFKCYSRSADASAIIIIAVVVSITTVLLYTTMVFITQIRNPQIFKPKRLKTRTSRYGSLAHTVREASAPTPSRSSVNVQPRDCSSIEEQQ